MEQIKNVLDSDFKLETSDYQYKYQETLTNKLDKINIDFNQNVINEIVLWKVNRYAAVDDEILELINTIGPNDKVLNVSLTRSILEKLLKCNGIQLAMASTILRFRNRYIYQHICQQSFLLIAKRTP
jgi:hypothetical protein